MHPWWSTHLSCGLWWRSACADTAIVGGWSRLGFQCSVKLWEAVQETAWDLPFLVVVADKPKLATD
jgi:hypothetical protein